MSVLTQKEKEALEDVFLSIQHKENLVKKFKNILKNTKKDSTFYNQNKSFIEYFIAKIGNFSTFFAKLKNFISK